jgi:hypothetical protein
MKIVALPMELIWDTDVPMFNREFHQGCVDYATYDLLCQDRRFEGAMTYWSRFVELREALRGGKAAGGAVEGGSRMRVVGGYSPR